MILITKQNYWLIINLGKIDYNLPHIPPNESRTLVSASINPANRNELIEYLFRKKLATYKATLISWTLLPTDIMEEYYKF